MGETRNSIEAQSTRGRYAVYRYKNTQKVLVKEADIPDGQIPELSYSGWMLIGASDAFDEERFPQLLGRWDEILRAQTEDGYWIGDAAFP